MVDIFLCLNCITFDCESIENHKQSIMAIIIANVFFIR